MERLTQFDAFAVPVAEVFYDEDFNCRGAFTLGSIEDLAASIGENGNYPDGLQFPVVVQPYDKQPGYAFRLLAGYRRFTACTRFLKWTHIPAQVRPNLSQLQARILNYTENLERKDLNILEEARALANTFCNGESLREIANAIKRETRWVHVRQKLLTLPEEVQEKAAAGLIMTPQITRIWALPSVEEQIAAAEEIAKVKRRGRTRSIAHLNPEYQPTFRPRKTKQMLQDMVGKMLEKGVEGLGPRALVWAAGMISDDELMADIKEQLVIQKRLRSVIPKCAPSTTKRRKT